MDNREQIKTLSQTTHMYNTSSICTNMQYKPMTAHCIQWHLHLDIYTTSCMLCIDSYLQLLLAAG